MKLVLVVLGVVAYGGVAGSDPATPVESKARSGTAEPPTQARGGDPDEGFRAAALALAARDRLVVLTWGPTHLDQSDPAREVRFAELHPLEVYGTTDPRGVFLIEQRPGALWLVTYRLRVRGTGGELTQTAPPPWDKLDARGIHHDYGFFNGHEIVDFALRDGKLVVLGYEYDGDYRNEFADHIVRDYAKGGCSPHCPALADFRFRRAGLHVIGPAATVDQLVDSEPLALGIDWPKLALKTDADALVVWRRLALARDQADLVWEIPEGAWRLPLASALLRSGGFVCPAARMEPTCQVASARSALALDDPCARRTLALWSLGVVGTSEGAETGVAEALRAIVRTSKADETLVRAAIAAAQHDRRLHQELIAIAWRARPRQHDELLAAIARYADDTALLSKLVGRLDAEAARTADCPTAAVIALGLDELAHESGQAGATAADPVRPKAGGTPTMMRALCVLASYRALGGKAGEPLASFIVEPGLDLTWFHYLRYPDERDRDGDGDPRSRRENETVQATDVDFPSDLPEALRNCSDTTCTATMHIYRFGFVTGSSGGLLLDRLEIRSRPPCAP